MSESASNDVFDPLHAEVQGYVDPALVLELGAATISSEDASVTNEHHKESDVNNNVSVLGRIYNREYKTTDLHNAVKEGNVERAKELLEKHKGDRDYVDSLDEAGDTPLHLATRSQDLTMINLLLENDADPRWKNLHTYTCQDEAVLTDNMEVLKAIYRVARGRKWKDWDEKLPSLMELMEKFDDFSLDVTYDVKSKIPLFHLFAPSDSFKLHKKGSNLRLDYTLSGYQNMRPKRGQNSIILFGRDSEHCGRFIRIDHLAKKYIDAFKQFQNPTEEEVQEELDALMNGKSKIHPDFELESSDVKLFRCCNREGVPITEQVGKWKCELYEMKGLRVKVQFARNIKEQARKEKENEEKERKRLEKEQQRHAKLLETQKRRSNSSPSFFRPFAGKAAEINTAIATPQSPPMSPTARTSSPKTSEHKKPAASGFSSKLDAQLYMASDFPIQLKDLLVIFDILAPFNKQFSEMKQLVEKQLPPGFPVKYVFPLMLDIRANAVFTEFRLGSPDPSLFTIPEGYECSDDIKLERKGFFHTTKQILDKKPKI